MTKSITKILDKKRKIIREALKESLKESILDTLKNLDLIWTISLFKDGVHIYGKKDNKYVVELEIENHIPTWFRLFPEDLILIRQDFDDKKWFKELTDLILQKFNSEYLTLTKNIKLSIALQK